MILWLNVDVENDSEYILLFQCTNMMNMIT